MAVANPLGIDLDQYKYGFRDPEDTYAFKSRKGLDREIVQMISHMKSEPDWMRAYRLHSLGVFEKKPTPTWGGNVGEINFDVIYYYVKPMENQGKTWEEVPALLPPGGVSFHHNLTYHGSGPNRTPEPRRSFALHLRTEHSRPVDDARKGLTQFIDDPAYCPVIYG